MEDNSEPLYEYFIWPDTFVGVWGDNFAELHQDKTGKFQTGDTVRYIGRLEHFHGNVYKVLACNRVDEKAMEYLLDGDFPYLVWEDEIEKEQK